MGRYFSYNPTMAESARVIAGLSVSPSERLIQVMHDVGAARVQVEQNNAAMMMKAAELNAAGMTHAADMAVVAQQKSEEMAFERERLEATKKNAADELAIKQGELDLKKKEFDAKYGEDGLLTKPVIPAKKNPMDASPDTVVKVDAALAVQSVVGSLMLVNDSLSSLFTPVSPVRPTRKLPLSGYAGRYDESAGFPTIPQTYTPPSRVSKVF